MELVEGARTQTYDILIRGQMDNFDKGDGLCQIIFKPDQFMAGSVYEGQVKECINKRGDKLMMFDGWGRLITETDSWITHWN